MISSHCIFSNLDLDRADHNLINTSGHIYVTRTLRVLKSGFQDLDFYKVRLISCFNISERAKSSLTC